MPTIIEKEHLPQVAYAHVVIDDNIVMFHPQVEIGGKIGFAAFYADKDEVRFVTNKEIAEYLKGVECTKQETVGAGGKKPRPVKPD